MKCSRDTFLLESGDLESIIRADEEARRMARHILEV